MEFFTFLFIAAIGGVAVWHWCRNVEPMVQLKDSEGPFTVFTLANDGTYKVRVFDSVRNLHQQLKKRFDYREGVEMPGWSFITCRTRVAAFVTPDHTDDDLMTPDSMRAWSQMLEFMRDQSDGLSFVDYLNSGESKYTTHEEWVQSGRRSRENIQREKDTFVA